MTKNLTTLTFSKPFTGLIEATIGITDQAVENQFVFIFSGTPVTWFTWAALQPDDYYQGQNPSQGEDCVTMDYMGNWQDRSCDTAYPYICEVELSGA